MRCRPGRRGTQFQTAKRRPRTKVLDDSSLLLRGKEPTPRSAEFGHEGHWKDITDFARPNPDSQL